MFEREEAQYQAGCFDNEFQAAYDLSRRTQEYPRDQAKAAAIAAAGRFAVVLYYFEYCRHTDAVLGQAAKLIADYATEAEAEAALALKGENDDPEHYYAVVGPRPPQPPPSMENSDDIPF
jgi:hypothetical protein